MLRFRIIFPLLAVLLFAPVLHAYEQIEFVREIGTQEKKTKQRQFNEPRAVGLSGDRIYVADTGGNRILALDYDGKTAFSWGTKGGKPGHITDRLTIPAVYSKF